MGTERSGEQEAESAVENGGVNDSSSNIEQTVADIYGGRRVVEGSNAQTVLGAVFVLAWGWLFGFFSGFLMLMGLVFLAMHFGNARTALASRRWPTTEAVVRESSVYTLRELRDQFEGVSRSGSTRGGYVPFVRYEYTVDGEKFWNIRLSPFDGPITRRRWAERMADRYPETEWVQVRYNPDRPGQSFLQLRTWAPGVYFWFLGSLVLLGGAVWLAFDLSIGAGVLSVIGDQIPSVYFVYAFAGAVALFAIYQFVTALRTYRWPTTSGTVRGTGVDTSSGSEGSTKYSPEIRYEYEVDDTSYVSSRIAVDDWPSFGSRSRARSWLEEYPDGDEVTVHYDPRRPDRSVLEPRGVLQAFFLLVLVGLGLAAVVVIQTGMEVPIDRLPIDRLPLG